MKKTLIILSIIIIIVGVAVLFYIFTRPSSPPATATQPGQTGSLPGAPTQQISSSTTNGGTGSSTAARFGVISNDPAIAYYVDAENNATIVEPNGFIETITNGQGTVISSSTAQNILSASFSYDGKKLLINFGSASNPQTGVFDIASRSWTGLPQGMLDPVWSPYNYQIAYLASGAGGTENITVLNAAAKNPQPSVLTQLNMEDMALQWPNRSTLVISDKPSAYTVSSAWLFNLSARTLAPVVYEYPGMESIWSNATTTTGLVFSGNTGNQGGRIFLVSPSGNPENITFVTLPSKCVFSMAAGAPQASSTVASSTANGTPRALASSTLDLYCAVPRDQATLAIARLPDEYIQKVIFTADDFYMINTTDGSLSSVFSNPNLNLDATDLNAFNNTLFFINRYDQKLYGISI